MTWRRRALVALAAIAIVASAIALRCGSSPAPAIAARAYPSYKPALPTAVVATVPAIVVSMPSPDRLS